MSPRNFEKIANNPIKLDDRVLNAPNFWYAFTAITGIDRLFSYTPAEITDKTAKHGEARVDEDTPNSL